RLGDLAHSPLGVGREVFTIQGGVSGATCTKRHARRGAWWLTLLPEAGQSSTPGRSTSTWVA
ncbi:MAG: hypothetical protein ACKOJF_16775, partial [Planctomycetaceae bacterium]